MPPFSTVNLPLIPEIESTFEMLDSFETMSIEDGVGQARSGTIDATNQCSIVVTDFIQAIFKLW